MNACTVMKLRGNYARMFNEDFFFWSFFKNLKMGPSKLDFWRSLVKDEIITQEISCKDPGQ